MSSVVDFSHPCNGRGAGRCTKITGLDCLTGKHESDTVQVEGILTGSSKTFVRTCGRVITFSSHPSLLMLFAWSKLFEV